MRCLADLKMLADGAHVRARRAISVHYLSEGSDILSRPSLAASKKRGFCSPLAACGGGVRPCTRAVALRLSLSSDDSRLTTHHSLRNARDRTPCHDPRLLRAKSVVFARRSPPAAAGTSLRAAQAGSDDSPDSRLILPKHRTPGWWPQGSALFLTTHYSRLTSK